jgi:prepilin-type N-terminal cleavage/methylation domain-containing protein/prepilin-type processing-associated H-X9-DG protein
MKKRSAFTLIELLVVIAIIGVLVGLLVPAVQKVREAASRTACSNNLKQIGLGLHNYHDANKKFPPSNTASLKKKHSWIPFILPYLEQDNLFQQYRFDKNWSSAKNKKAVSTPLRLFQCPATPVQDRVDGKFKSLPACVDYNAVEGVSPNLVLLGFVPPTLNLHGIMFKNSNTKLTDIWDGTSNTIMVGEDAGRPQVYLARHQPVAGYATGGAWADPKGPFTLNGSSYDGTVIYGPCGINCNNNNEFYSFHQGFAGALFADGHVQFLQDQISIRTLAALVTYLGEEPVSPPD